ncbi:MAG: hypothetical protein AAB948_02260, partial [Patescibacteria group bacterium]
PTTFKLEVAGSIGPEADNTRDLGSGARRWANLYATNITGAVGAVTPGSGAFTTLTSSGNTTLATGAGTTNTLGAGASSINTIGSATTPGTLTLLGSTIVAGSANTTAFTLGNVTTNPTLTLLGTGLTTLGGNLTVTGTSWTATPTISGLITATSGLTSNGTLTVGANQNFVMSSGTGTATQTFTGTTTVANTITANSLTTGTGFDVNTINTATTNTPLSAISFDITNAQTTLANSSITGLAVNFTNNPTVAGNTDTAVRIQNQATSNVTDNLVDSLLLLDNADTVTLGTTVVTDAIKITNTGGAGYTNFLNTPTIDISAAGAITGAASYNGLVVTANTGVITTGTWNGTTIAVANGGTGATTFTANGVLYGNTTGAIQATAQGAANTVLVANAGAPSFSAAIIVGTSVTSPSLVATTAVTTPSIITASGALTVTPAAGSNLNVNLSTTGDFAVNTNQLYVDTSAANVGIGTTPVATNKLQVNQTGTADGSAGIAVSTSGVVTGTNYGLYSSVSGASVRNWGLYINSGDAHVAGNVGIGSTAPAARLHIDGTNSLIYTEPASDNGQLSGLKMLSSPGLVVSGITTNSLTGEVAVGSLDSGYFTALYGGATEKVRITSTGFVGIGTTNPGAKVDIQLPTAVAALTAADEGLRLSTSTVSTSNITHASSPFIKLFGGIWNGTTNSSRGFTQQVTGISGTNNGYRLAIGSTDFSDALSIVGLTGNVGINTTTPTTFKLEVAGSIGPEADNTRDLGSSGRRFANLYATNVNTTNLSLSGLTQGSMLFAGASGAVSQDNANLFFDDTNDTFGVGTTRTGAISATNPRMLIKGAGAITNLTLQTTDSANNETFFVQDGGRVGVRYNPFTIGMTSAETPVASARLQVVGSSITTVIDWGSTDIVG